MPTAKGSGSVLYSQNVIVRLTFEFSIDLVRYTEQLENLKRYVIARQMLWAGTSIGAYVKEAQNAESKADFVHKVKLALKEADETEYWIKICDALEHYPNTQTLNERVQIILKILNRIVGTSKRNVGSR